MVGSERQSMGEMMIYVLIFLSFSPVIGFSAEFTCQQSCEDARTVISSSSSDPVGTKAKMVCIPKG